jgi:hypothetical protein
MLKIPAGTTVNDITIKPQLELGSSASEFVYCETNRLTIDLTEYMGETLYPSDDLFPSDNLFPAGTIISYILIQGGVIYVSADNKLYCYGNGNVRLFNGYNLLYTLQDANLNIDYFTDELVIEDYMKEINIKVERKVDNEDFTGANIMLAINNDTSSAVINADKISLNGKEINLTSDDISITSDNFNVDSEGKVDIISSETNARLTVRKNKDENNHIVAAFPGWIEMAGSSEEAVASYYYDGFVLFNETKNFLAELRESTTGHYLFMGAGDTYCDITPQSITTPQVIQTSKEESKKNFEKLENGLDIVKNTDIYKYNLKAEEDTDKKHIGFVIGDNYNYSQEITSQNNDGVDTYSMISVAYKAIQELLEQNEDLKARIEALEKGEK